MCYCCYSSSSSRSTCFSFFLRSVLFFLAPTEVITITPRLFACNTVKIYKTRASFVLFRQPWGSSAFGLPLSCCRRREENSRLRSITTTTGIRIFCRPERPSNEYHSGWKGNVCLYDATSANRFHERSHSVSVGNSNSVDKSVKSVKNMSRALLRYQVHVPVRDAVEKLPSRRDPSPAKYRLASGSND